MNPGKLKHKITFQKHTCIEDSNHVSKDEWQDVCTVWCSMNNLFGKEYWSAKQYQAENTVEFIIRYGAYKNLSVKDRINFNGKLFNISSIDNVKYENKFIKIKAMELS